MRIKVYTYCSYKFSPVGFRHGVFQLDTENSNNEYVVPTIDSDISPVVRNCFVERSILKAMGKIPGTNEYIILFKGLECDFVNEDGMPAKKYGNFAFSTTDPTTYNNINTNISALSMLQLSEAMNSFLIPDSNAGDAAIKIDTKRFIDFLVSLSSTSHSAESLDEFNIISNASGDKVTKTLEERFPEYSVIPLSGYHFQLKKKSLDAHQLPIVQYIKARPIMAIPMILAMIAAITVILILILI